MCELTIKTYEFNKKEIKEICEYFKNRFGLENIMRINYEQGKELQIMSVVLDNERE